MSIYTPEQETEIVRRYTAGESAASLVRVFGGSRPSLGKVLDRHGVTERHRVGRLPWRTFTPEQGQEMRRLWHEGLSQAAVAKRFETTQRIVRRVLIEHGVQPVHRVGNPPGTNHLRGVWRGRGRTVNKEGYVLVKIQPDHPFALMRHHNGYVKEHRLVIAQALGRPLCKDETVHHINNVKDDNRLENLQLRHGKHGKGIVLVCGDCGSTNIVSETLA